MRIRLQLVKAIKSMPKVVIQRVHCLWTKESRGGEGARIRNAVPLAVPLRRIDGDSAFTLHATVFSESTHFKQIDAVKTADDVAGLGLSDLVIRRDGDVVHVQFVRSGYNAARPSSYPHHDVFGLRLNDWLRIVTTAGKSTIAAEIGGTSNPLTMSDSSANVRLMFLLQRNQLMPFSKWQS
ncbi:MAG TPA: hypothetical protein VGM98_25870 [Schlesneria sp.]